MQSILFYIVGAVLLGWGYLCYIESRLLFAPARTLTATPQSWGLPFDDIYFTTEDQQKLHAWFMPANQDVVWAATLMRPTILYLHGNAGNIGDRLEKIALFHHMGVNVFIVDYRGYGRSQGRPSEKGVYHDARAAYDYVVKQLEVLPASIYVYGVSLGGAVAVDLVQHRAVAGLILDSTFSSVKDMGQWLFPWMPGQLIQARFDSVHKIQKSDGLPKLFFHSTDDRTVPLALGQKLYNKAPEPKKMVLVSGAHTEAHIWDRPRFQEVLRQFLMGIHQQSAPKQE